MLKFVLIFLTALSSLNILREILNIVKVFRRGEEYKRPWYMTLISMLSISFLITVMIIGI